ncbi:MAG: rhodanese-like domain-containing protein [Chloroflexota bacterium]
MDAIISCHDLAALMATDQLYAVFDVRERGEFNECQIFHATSLPRSQIEFRIAELVPDRSVPIVVYGDGDVRAPLAAATLLRLGYEQVAILQEGLGAWKKEGRPTVSGVNVPSKAFGEKVHHDRGVPDLSPQELKELKSRIADLMILDVRTPEEYGRFCIPGGINVPGGDLILWAEDLKRKEAPIIVNCAGRTRSIIGTAALRRLGLNNVRALRNGTMGWVLAGLELESKPRRAAPRASLGGRDKAVALARRIAAEENLCSISLAELARWKDAKNAMRYLIDVRSESEFEAGHLPGSLSVPGGQAVQRADDFVAVRDAPIVFISDQSARAVMAAYWYRQMGFPKVFVLEGGLEAWSARGGAIENGAVVSEPLGLAASKAQCRAIEAQALDRTLRESSPAIVDVGSSLEFESAHLPGAQWLSRGWVEPKMPELFSDHSLAIVLTCPDGRQSTLAARTLGEMGYRNVAVLAGGVRAWSAAGLRVEQGLTDCLTPTNDVVLSPSIRGTKEDMQRYLDWEVKLER